MIVTDEYPWGAILENVPGEFDGVELADTDFGVGGAQRGRQLLLPKNDLDAGYQIERITQGDTIVRSVQVDRWLCSSPQAGLSIDQNYEESRLEWIMNHKCRPLDYLRFKLAMFQESLVNEEKIALAHFLCADAGSITIGRTSYFATVATNEACTRQLGKSGESWRDFRSLFPVHSSTGSLLGLSESNLSNQIGASTLGFTKDRRFVVWTQTTGSQRSLGKKVPTGSGSIVWTDFSHSLRNDLLSVVKFGMARELSEEAGLAAAYDIPGLADVTYVLGYFRWVEMGGLPEFIGVTRLGDVSSKDLKPDCAEVSIVLDAASSEFLPIYTLKDAIGYCAQMKMRTDLSTPLCAIVDRLQSILTESGEESARSAILELLEIAR